MVHHKARFPLAELTARLSGKWSHDVNLTVYTGGRHGYCSTDHIIHARTSHRLQQAVHAAWHQHHDQKAGETEAWRVLVHGPARREGLAVDHVLVPGSQLCPVPGEPVQLEGVADRRQSARPDILQRFYDPQQPLVLSWRLHASRLRCLSKVSLIVVINVEKF